MVLRLEADDEITSVLHKVKTADGNRIALVLPDEPRVFRNEVNLRLLAAYGRQSGREIAFVTDDAAVVARAAAAGIDAYPEPSVAFQPEAALSPDALPRPESRASPRRTGPWIAVTIAVSALGLLAYTLVPRAVIEVIPDARPLAAIVEVQVGAGAVPAERFEFASEAEAVVDSTGVVRVGVTRSQGVVVFLHEGLESITVPARTRVGTEGGVWFHTLEAVRVPAVTREEFLDVVVGLRAGRAEVAVEAVEPGTPGNVGSGRVRVIEGYDADALQVRNPEALQGGTDRTYPVVREADLTAGREAAMRTLLAQAKSDLGHGLGPGWEPIPESLSLVRHEVVSSPDAGTQAEQVAVRAVGEFEVQVVRRDRLEDAARRAVAAQIPEGYVLSSDPPVRLLRFEPVTGGYVAAYQVTADIHARLDPIGLARRVAGLRPDAAAELLTASGQVAGVTVPEIDGVLPQWAPWIAVRLRLPATQAAVAGGGS